MSDPVSFADIEALLARWCGPPPPEPNLLAHMYGPVLQEDYDQKVLHLKILWKELRRVQDLRGGQGLRAAKEWLDLYETVLDLRNREDLCKEEIAVRDNMILVLQDRLSKSVSERDELKQQLLAKTVECNDLMEAEKKAPAAKKTRDVDGGETVGKKAKKT